MLNINEVIKMTKLFDDFMQGMAEIMEHEQGKRKLRVDKVVLKALDDFSAHEIKNIRCKMAMSQNLFASIIGVSAKTVEAWEAGRNKPSGASIRMLQLLENNPAISEVFYAPKIGSENAHTTARSVKKELCKT